MQGLNKICGSAIAWLGWLLVLCPAAGSASLYRRLFTLLACGAPTSKNEVTVGNVKFLTNSMSVTSAARQKHGNQFSI